MSFSYLSVCSTWSRKFKKRVARTVHGGPCTVRPTFFSIQNIAKTIFFHFICRKNTDTKKFAFWTKTMDVNPFANFDFLSLLQRSIFWSKKHSFLSRISKSDFETWFLNKKAHKWKNLEFKQKPWANPFKTFDFFFDKMA